MKTATTMDSAAVVALGAGHETTTPVPAASALLGKLRKALTNAIEWVTGTELARTRFLSQATDLPDLERRIDAWERA